jgi:hypothetical protein
MAVIKNTASNVIQFIETLTDIFHEIYGDEPTAQYISEAILFYASKDASQLIESEQITESEYVEKIIENVERNVELYETFALIDLNILLDVLIESDVGASDLNLIFPIIFEQTEQQIKKPLKQRIKELGGKLKELKSKLASSIKNKLNAIKNTDKYTVYRKLSKYGLPITAVAHVASGLATSPAVVASNIAGGIVGKVPLVGRHLRKPFDLLKRAIIYARSPIAHSMYTGYEQWKYDRANKKGDNKEKELRRYYMELLGVIGDSPSRLKSLKEIPIRNEIYVIAKAMNKLNNVLGKSKYIPPEFVKSTKKDSGELLEKFRKKMEELKRIRGESSDEH